VGSTRSSRLYERWTVVECAILADEAEGSIRCMRSYVKGFGRRNPSLRNHLAHHAQLGLTTRHVSKLYLRIRFRNGSSVAIGAVARHLAESTFWILSKNEPYGEVARVSPRQG